MDQKKIKDTALFAYACEKNKLTIFGKTGEIIMPWKHLRAFRELIDQLDHAGRERLLFDLSLSVEAISEPDRRVCKSSKPHGQSIHKARRFERNLHSA
jgi:hypothetical protein